MDDCLLSFTPRIHIPGQSGRTFNLTKQFVLHPPLFTIKIDNVNYDGISPTSFQDPKFIAMSAKCGTLYENILYHSIRQKKISAYKRPTCVNIFTLCQQNKLWPTKTDDKINYPGNHLPFGHTVCEEQTHRKIENSISFHEYASKIKRTANTMTPSDVQHWKSKIPMIYINIESKKERNEHMKKTFSNLFGTITRSEGVLQDSEEVQKITMIIKNEMDRRKKNFPFHSPNAFEINNRILAVTLSHLNAIKLAKKTITELNNPLIQHAVIMEDDADIILMPFWQRSLDEIVKTFPSGWEVVQLAFTKVDEGISPLYSRFAYPREPIIEMGAEWGAIAYIISRAGMDKILSINMFELYR